jgi:hypothetical protein
MEGGGGVLSLFRNRIPESYQLFMIGEDRI